MVALEIEPGAFVWYPAKGLGRVQWVGADDASVLFWADRKSGKTEKNISPFSLKLLPGNAPEGKPGDYGFADWTKKAPLTLAAVALSECEGRVGRDSDIRGNLADRALSSSSLGSWWKRVQPKLTILPEHFRVWKPSGDVEYALLSDIADVPPDVSTLLAWENWLLGSTFDPPPELFPTSELSEALTKWPKKNIEQVLDQTLRGAEMFFSEKPSAVLAWMEAVGSVAKRWTDLYPDEHQKVQRCGEVLALLSQFIQVKEKRKEATLFWAGALSENPDRQRQLDEQRREQKRQRDIHSSELEKLRQERQRDHVDYEKRLEQERQERKRREAVHAEELESLRAYHSAERERERQEKERLQKQVRDLDAELDAKRETANLEVRRGMLLAVGEVMQSVRHHRNLDELVGDVEAGLAIALRAGDSEPLETPGALVSYKPHLHDASEDIAGSKQVKVVAPGVIARSGAMGDKVLLKAQVKREGM